VKLSGVREGDLGGLIRYSAADFGDAVADVDDRGLTGRVEKVAATFVNDPAAFAADGEGIVYAEISRKQSGVGWHADGQIVADENLDGCGDWR
jgi:hypothetical protein